MKFSKNRSLAVMIFGIILPEVVTYLYNRIFSNDFQFILQYITGFIIFFSSLFLFISSVRGLFKSEKSEKLLRIIVSFFSILVLLCISLILYIQLSLRDGIGF